MKKVAAIPVLLFSILLLVACNGGGSAGDESGGGTNDGGGGGGNTNDPSVVSTQPADNAADVGLDPEINATFNTDMLATSINANSVLLTSGGSQVPASVQYDEMAKQVNIVPDASLKKITNYTVSLDSSIADLNGNSLGGYSFNFTTLDSLWTYFERMDYVDLSATTCLDVCQSQHDVHSNYHFDMNESGIAAAAWNQRIGRGANPYDGAFASIYVPGSGWQTPLLLGTMIEGYDSHSIQVLDLDETGKVRIIAFVNYRITSWTSGLFLFLYDPATGWTVENMLDQPNLQVVHMQVLADDSLMLISEEYGGVGHTFRTYSTAAGLSAPVVLRTPTNPSKPITIESDRDGNMIFASVEGDSSIPSTSLLVRTYQPGTGWSDSVQISANNKSVRIHSLGQGEFLLTSLKYDSSNAGTFITGQSYDPVNGWSADARISGNIGSWQSYNTFDMSFSENQEYGMIVWDNSLLTDDRQVLNAITYTKADGWGTTEMINNYVTTVIPKRRQPEVVLDNRGNAVVVWLQEPCCIPQASHTRYSRYVNGTGWGEDVPLEGDNLAAFENHIVMSGEGNAMLLTLIGPPSSGSTLRFQLHYSRFE